MPNGVTREQIDLAKQVNILDYVLAHESNNVKRSGNAHYLKDHDSLRISNGLWKWESQGIGGKNVVDYLIKVRGYSFVDAVRHLTGDNIPAIHIAPRARPPTERKPFTLPPRSNDNTRTIAYLQGRGIDKQCILDCIKNGSLYESGDMWHNAVFTGRDENGKARYASLRGTTGDFKRDADGSEKQYGFILPPTDLNSDTVAVFESPVDALSHQTLCPEFDGWRLSLGCTALVALTHFLERHGEVKHVIVCTDNDRAGNLAAAKITELQDITVIRALPPANHKDWNDALIAQKSENKPSLLDKLEAAKVTAAEVNSLAARERTGNSLCL